MQSDRLKYFSSFTDEEFEMLRYYDFTSEELEELIKNANLKESEKKYCISRFKNADSMSYSAQASGLSRTYCKNHYNDMRNAILNILKLKVKTYKKSNKN